MGDEHTYDSWGSRLEQFENGTTCIGIDLGTTNSCVGYWKIGFNHVKIVKDIHDRTKTLPSVVRFYPDNNSVDVGKIAIENEYNPVGNTVRCIKRLMGQQYPSQAINIAKTFSTYSIVPTSNQKAAVSVARDNQKAVIVEAEEISACILERLKLSVESYLGKKAQTPSTIENAVVTVPAYFSDAQRKATIKAATKAGFNGIRLLNEPTAAAMAYGLFLSGSKIVIVFDFGGGTLDVSLMHINDGKFDVLGITGDTNLGGEDINNVIINYILKKINLSKDSLTTSDLIALKSAVECAKIELSKDDKASIHVDCTSTNIRLDISRNEFEVICEDIWSKCLRLTTSVLKEAEVSSLDVDEIIMVGGSTRIPILRTKLSELFHGKELCYSVDPDQVVAEGAAIQAAILSGVDHRVFRDVLMMDVIPLSIGLEKADGNMEVLLPKNSKIPISKTKYFETYEPNQPGLTVDIYEGENEVAKLNECISRFNFPIPKSKINFAPGEILHPVTFTMNASGVLQVQAGIHHDSEDEPMSWKSLVIMSGYIAFLFMLYVGFRLYFPRLDNLAIESDENIEL